MSEESTVIAPGTLYIMATPIGNLGDISSRALEILHQVDFVLCEDTRHSSILLDHYQIRKKLVSYFAHNEALRTDQFLPRLQAGESAALITDAGTPGISDPGSRLVDACLNAGIRVSPVPGASAVVSAVSASGFYDFTRFEFVAFFPRKSSERKELFESCLHREALLVGYESPQRIESLLEDLVAVAGPDRRICMCRELTKKFETIARTTVGALLEEVRLNPVKGELCLVIEGELPKESRDNADLSEEDKKLALLLKQHGMSARDIKEIVSAYSGVKSKSVYQFLVSECSCSGLTE